MPTLYPQNSVPVVDNTGGLTEHSDPVWKLTSPSDTHTNAIWPGCWVVASTLGYIAVASNFAAADYEVIRIRDRQHQNQEVQLVATTVLNTASTVFELEVKPLGGVPYRMTEDADTTPITDASVNANLNANVLVTEPVDTGSHAPTRAPQGKYLIDSSTVSTTTGRSVKLKAVSTIAGNPVYSATTLLAPRVFLATVLTPGQNM